MSVLYLRAVGWTECFFVGCGWLVGWLPSLVVRWSAMESLYQGPACYFWAPVQFASNSLQGFSELQLAGAGSCWASPLGALASSWVGGRSARLEV